MDNKSTIANNDNISSGIDDREDHGISTYDDDEELRIKIAKMGLKI